LEEIEKKNWDYTLCQDNDGAHILSVVCGSIALYELEIQLNEFEIAEYSTKGLVYLEKLVKQIRNNPDSFQNRSIKNQ